MTPEKIRQLAEPVLKGIQPEMTETFGISRLDIVRCVNVVVASVTGTDYVCFNIAEGLATPAYTSAPGKAMFANLPAPARKKMLQRILFESSTPNTILSKTALEKEFTKIRARGYAEDNEEEKIGVRCGGVAVFDGKGNPVCAVWLSGLAKRLTARKYQRQVMLLKRAAALLQAKIRENEKGKQTLSPLVQEAVRKLSTVTAGGDESAFRGETLARLFGVSYSTLRMAFAREVGVPIAQYRLTFRLNQACRLLKEKKLSVTEVAAQLGFCSQKYFSGLFKRKFGVPPSRSLSAVCLIARQGVSRQ